MLRPLQAPLLALVPCLLSAALAHGSDGVVSDPQPQPLVAALDVIGVGDQHLGLFTERHFAETGIRRVRYFVPWNAMERPPLRTQVLTYARNARAHGVNVLMHVYTNDLRIGRGRLPTPAQYRRSVGRLVRALRPLGVNAWGVWNEANHKSEPTFRHPERAAQYFAIMREECRGCRIVALDVLDVPGAESYIDRFYGALSPALRRDADLVGIHPYADVNRGGFARTAAIIARVRRHVRAPRFWLTEAGGIVYYPPNFPCSQRRAAQATGRLFDLVEHFSGIVDRAYVYNWIGTDCEQGFDTGLLDADGTPRAAYTVLRRRMASFTGRASYPQR